MNLPVFNNIEELFTVFVQKIKGDRDKKFEHYRNIINTIGFLKENREKVQIGFNNFSKDFRRYEDSWNNANGEIINYIEECIYRFKRKDNSNKEDNFIFSLDKITAKWQNSENHRYINTIKINLIDPLWKLCKDTNFENERAIMLMRSIRNANIAYRNYFTIKELYSEFFVHNAGMTMMQGNKIELAYNYYIEK